MAKKIKEENRQTLNIGKKMREEAFINKGKNPHTTHKFKVSKQAVQEFKSYIEAMIERDMHEICERLFEEHQHRQAQGYKRQLQKTVLGCDVIRLWSGRCF